MSDTSPTYKARTGVVTFLDVLGWKGVYDRQSNAITNLKRLIESLRSRVQQQRGRLSGPDDPVEVKSISDTIALFTFCDEKEAPTAIEIHGELCQWLIAESIKLELPMRGATAFGEFEISENIFVGKAVDEAASWHEQCNWIGVNLSPSAEFVFSSKAKKSVWIPYSAPIKTPMKWQPHCVNWVADWILPETKKKDVRSAFRRMGPILPEIAPKFINTLDFIDEMMKSHSVADGQIVVVVEGRTDTEIVNAIAHCIGLNKKIFLEVANGKHRMFENAKEYALTFQNAAGIIFLIDSNTENSAETETQSNYFSKIISESEHPHLKVIWAVPEIETWLGKTEFRRDKTRHYNKLFEELHNLQQNLESKADSVPSLKEFITTLKGIDAQP